MGNLDGKVAIVTGGGRGLGRVEAIALAKQGARLVINDLGTTGEGSGSDEEPARQVAEEIKAFGGEAIVAFGDVANWDDTAAMIKKTIDTYGDLNIVVNNAGFLRDGMIFNMSEEQFDSVVRVHLKGHFCSMRMATEYWRNKAKAGESVYGRLVSTSSEAFLFGSVGQPNYAAAKAGITAMTMAAAQAMVKYGVTANVVCPRARTRMNDSGPHAALFAKPESGFDKYAPENLGPFIAYLASPQAQRISGEVFVVWGKQVTVVGRPTLDTKFKNAAEGPWTVDSLHQQLGPYFEQREPVVDGFSVPPQ
jgi:3-oxoacyl-[acyl-carrier protein] reductase